MSTEPKAQFISALTSSLENQEFIRLTLGQYKGHDSTLTKIVARVVQLKSGLKLSFTYHHKTNEMVKNHSIPEGIGLINTLIGTEFMSARVFGLKQDVQLECRKKGEMKLSVMKPTFTDPESTVPQAHNHLKKRSIDAKDNAYLTRLGITNQQGEIVRSMEDKFRQINKFVEIVQGLLEPAGLTEKDEFSVVDMGSGKGYLTFAIYDFLNTNLGKKVSVTGIESRKELADFCQSTAVSVGFDGLTFEHGTIQSCTVKSSDVTIALHACDTATDDAIYKGIQARSSLIILSPCCHKQIRKEVQVSGSLKSLLKFGILLERQSELVTDGLRALLLEWCGYETKVFEFISSEHTSKNLMIVGVKHNKQVDRGHILTQIKEIKNLYGIKFHYLEGLLFPESLMSPNLIDRAEG